VINLILKSNLEEKLLTQRFDTYQDYRNKTGRFLPFLYTYEQGKWYYHGEGKTKEWKSRLARRTDG
jgi:hypothetical protein